MHQEPSSCEAAARTTKPQICKSLSQEKKTKHDSRTLRWESGFRFHQIRGGNSSQDKQAARLSSDPHSPLFSEFQKPAGQQMRGRENFAGKNVFRSVTFCSVLWRRPSFYSARERQGAAPRPNQQQRGVSGFQQSTCPQPPPLPPSPAHI